ncbi:hypothetical protein JTE90_011247 [Oedothorax gibbosus]|uniref:Secreted protein n=1 Tax=Oedothorax gibbosus TaxID=931172 RepID=A0AAV6W2R0_9ARAC|nr:hypothetical protein JTE90_011247 [Oedothorax gibbosus]
MNKCHTLSTTSFHLAILVSSRKGYTGGAIVRASSTRGTTTNPDCLHLSRTYLNPARASATAHPMGGG